jgi:hypothetical protein
MSGDKARRRIAEQFRMKTTSSQAVANPQEAREAEAAKTTRLRALRLAKEAADRDAEQSAAKAGASCRSPSSAPPKATALRAARAKAKSHS